MLIHAPFTDEQVKRMKEYQSNNMVHPYTCNNGHTLEVETDGLKCKACGYSQKWIHHYSVMTGIYNAKR